MVAGGWKLPRVPKPSKKQQPASTTPAPCCPVAPPCWPVGACASPMPLGAGARPGSDTEPVEPAGVRNIPLNDKGTTGNEFLGPDYLYVDVHLATPYGMTSHLLIPAWHLGKSGEEGGSGGGTATGGSGSDGAGSGSQASGADSATTPASALAGWASKELTLGFVYQGAGIAPAGAPMYQPKELSINLGSYFALAGGTSITLQKMKLGGGAKGTLPDLVVPITATNFNANTKVLKITGSDMQNLIARIFNEVQYQFGPEATKPPTAVTVSGTTVVAPGRRRRNYSPR